MSEAGTATRVWTAGYQGEELDAFIRKLQDARITLLVDIRRRAQSRKKGFSKSALRNALAK